MDKTDSALALVKEINVALRDLVWYQEDKDKQRNALSKVHFLASMALMELDGYFEQHQEDDNDDRYLE